MSLTQGRSCPLGRWKRTERTDASSHLGHPNVVIWHADSGYAPENLIVTDFERIDRRVAEGCPIILILDVYPF
jgi:hypothetical protein